MPVFHFANGMEQHPVSQDQSLPPAAPVRQHFQKDGGTSHGEAIRKHENMVLYSLLVILAGKIPFFGFQYLKLIINHRAMFHWKARNPKCWIAMKRIEISPTCWLCRVWSVLTCSIGWEKFMPPPSLSHFLPGTAPEAPAESMLTCYNPSWKPKLAGKYEKIYVPKWFQHRLAFRMWWVGPGVGWNV